MSPELRQCTYFTSSTHTPHGSLFDWKRYEPNTGIMRIRDTPGGRAMLLRWLEELVDVNKANDQPYLSSHLLNFTIVNDCHYDFDATPSEGEINGRDRGPKPNSHYGSDTSYGSTINQSINTTTTNSTIDTINPPPQQYTLCYLQETLFQNGQLAFMCAEEKDKRHPAGYHTEYMLQVNIQTFDSRPSIFDWDHIDI